MSGIRRNECKSDPYSLFFTELLLFLPREYVALLMIFSSDQNRHF